MYLSCVSASFKLRADSGLGTLQEKWTFIEKPRAHSGKNFCVPFFFSTKILCWLHTSNQQACNHISPHGFLCWRAHVYVCVCTQITLVPLTHIWCQLDFTMYNKIIHTSYTLVVSIWHCVQTYMYVDWVRVVSMYACVQLPPSPFMKSSSSSSPVELLYPILLLLLLFPLSGTKSVETRTSVWHSTSACQKNKTKDERVCLCLCVCVCT